MTDHVASNHLSEVIHELLRIFGITTVEGPPCAYFEMDGERYIYTTFRYGVTDDELDEHGAEGRVVELGRFKTAEDLTYAVLDDLAKKHLTAKRPLVWRRKPEIEVERGFYKAYFRFVQVPTQEIADKAAAIVLV